MKMSPKRALCGLGSVWFRPVSPSTREAPVSVQRVVERLQQLGMSGYEAKAYVALISADRPVNGYEVAKRSGVPRSTVYETLSKLVARGAAYEVKGPESSTDYLPLPPAHLLDRMQRE